MHTYKYVYIMEIKSGSSNSSVQLFINSTIKLRAEKTKKPEHSRFLTIDLYE